MRSVNSDDILDGKIYVSTFQRWQAWNKEGTKNKDNQITNNKTTQVTIKGNKIMLLYFRQDCIIFLFILRFSFIRPIEWIKECKHNVHWNSLYALDINSEPPCSTGAHTVLCLWVCLWICSWVIARSIRDIRSTRCRYFYWAEIWQYNIEPQLIVCMSAM